MKINLHQQRKKFGHMVLCLPTLPGQKRNLIGQELQDSGLPGDEVAFVTYAAAPQSVTVKSSYLIPDP